MPEWKRDMCWSGVHCGVEYHHNEQEKITMTNGMTYLW